MANTYSCAHFPLTIHAGRRTRAAQSNSSLKTSACKANGLDAVAAADQHFASPKRKDFKLDTDAMAQICADDASPNGLTTSGAANGRRPNKAASGPRSKKPAPKTAAITQYFAIVDGSPGAHTADPANDSCTIIEAASPPPAPPASESPVKSVQSDGCAADGAPAVVPPSVMLMSPELKAPPGDLKQTTPHRIVCHSSPSTKRRPYAKDTAHVFSALNIHDGSSPKPKANRRRNQPRSRRKLNVENNENGESNGFAVPNAPAADKAIGHHTCVANGNGPHKHAVRDTLMNDYFPIRRSVRKTQKAIEEEQMRYIEKAIDEQRQDGLSIREFANKGRGIVAARPFQRGEFVVEYIGELIDQNEADNREERYMKNVNFGCYMYYFRHKEQQWW